MTSTPQPKPTTPDQPCCGGEAMDPGTAGGWLPKKGEPQANACQLCPVAEKYWNKPAS